MRLLSLLPPMLVAPGPKGPMATDHNEAYRQGVEECEARTVIERGIYDEEAKGKLGAELTRRCEDYINGRHAMMWLSLNSLQCCKKRGGGSNVSGHNWFVGSGWQERTAELYGLAGEVQRKVKGE